MSGWARPCDLPVSRTRCLDLGYVRPAPGVSRWLVLEPSVLAPLGRQTDVTATIIEKPVHRAPDAPDVPTCEECGSEDVVVHEYPQYGDVTEVHCFDCGHTDVG